MYVVLIHVQQIFLKSIEHATNFLSNYISKCAINMKFWLDIGNIHSNPHMQYTKTYMSMLLNSIERIRKGNFTIDQPWSGVPHKSSHRAVNRILRRVRRVRVFQESRTTSGKLLLAGTYGRIQWHSAPNYHLIASSSNALIIFRHQPQTEPGLYFGLDRQYPTWVCETTECSVAFFRNRRQHIGGEAT